MATLEGQQLGPYQVLQQMGTGGMATVYKAYHARLDRHVAIKVMHEAFLEDENFITRFEREAQIVARLEHPNIVPVYDFSEIEGRPYLVMKQIEGQTLKARMLRQPPTLAEIKRILPQIADALDYAHRSGILHRDIKPSNIIIDPQGVPYLTDFGLARIAQLGESTLSQDVVLGTPQYISPEQAMGKRELAPATDLYSLGVVLYEMVVGRVPFSSDTPFATIHDHIYRALPTPSEVNPELKPEIDRVLEKALAKRPDERYRTATEMVMAFLTAVDQTHIAALNPQRGEIAAASLARLREAEGEDDELTTPLPVAPKAIPSPLPAAQQKVVIKSPDVDDASMVASPTGESKRKVEMAFDLGNVDWSQIGRRIERAIDGKDGNIFEKIGSQIEDAVEGQKPVDHLLTNDPDSIRKRVEHQFKKRREFNIHLIVFVLGNLLMWVIFGMAAGVSLDFEGIGNAVLLGEFPWPLIVLFGWGAGLFAHGVETFYDTGRRLRRRAEAVERELIRTYGEDWSRVADKKGMKAIRKRVEKPYKKVSEFFQHIGVYIMINLLLWTIYISSNDGLAAMLEGGTFIQNMDFPWPLIVTLAWGLGVVINGFEALSTGAEERAVQREIEREESRVYGGKPKRAYDSMMLDAPANPVRMTEEGEFTESMIQELKEEERRGQTSRRG